MKNIYMSLIVWFVCNTKIFGNTFFQGKIYQLESMIFLLRFNVVYYQFQSGTCQSLLD